MHIHIHNHMRPLAGACRANERHPAAQPVTVVEEDNVNINRPVIAVEYWEDRHNGKVVASRDRQRFLKHNCGPLTNSTNCLMFLYRTFVPIGRIAFCPQAAGYESACVPHLVRVDSHHQSPSPLCSEKERQFGGLFAVATLLPKLCRNCSF